MATTIKHIVLAALALALPGAVQAQAARNIARKEARAQRIAPGTPSPRLDGRLDDPAWANAQFVSDMVAKEPVEGAPPRALTRLAFAYDGDALYVAARMESERPGDIPVLVTRRDTWGVSEVLFVSFDTYHDRRTAYTFGVTSAGTRVDYYQPTDDELSRDFGYDPVWEARVSVDSTGWSAELRIPFSQLRFTDRTDQVWGLNVNRYAPLRNESLFWMMVPKNENGWSSRFGNLVGIGGIHPSRRLELVPYGTTNATLRGARDPANPFDDGRNLAARAGTDLKMGLGPSLTLDATANPDFGQVEADPAEVNLSAFPTFFTEKRPFFAEGSDLLQMAGFFYSRRIGAPPHGAATGSFLARPQNSTILGAGKLTGRLSPSLSIAALSAVTDRESARSYDIGTGTISRIPIEPLTGYGAAKLVKKFGSAGSTAGLMMTGVHRDLPSGPLGGILTNNAMSGGSNGVLRFAGGKYQATYMVGASYVRGDTSAIRRIQQNSAHYLQRPDAQEGGYDPRRTSLTGYTFSYRFDKLAGKHWIWDAWGEVESPTFEINDIGRLTAGNDIDNYFDIKYRETRPTRLLYNYNIGFSTKTGYNFGGERQFTFASLNPSLTWKSYLFTWASVSVDFASISDALTRGGPLMGTPQTRRVSGGFNTNDRQPTYWLGRFELKDDDLGGWGYTVSGTFTARPSGQWSLSLAPQYIRSIEPRQYLATVAGGGAATFGQRYVFSFIDRSTLSAQIRLSYLVRPELTIEAYAEPFAASGRYYGIGELAAARSRDLRVYGTAPGTTLTHASDGTLQITDGASSFSLANPDFNIVSFRSNLVLRWEWRAGSTMYLVWQQNRTGQRSVGDLVGPGRLWDSFTATGDNFLALKVAYWLPVL